MAKQNQHHTGSDPCAINDGNWSLMTPFMMLDTTPNTLLLPAETEDQKEIAHAFFDYPEIYDGQDRIRMVWLSNRKLPGDMHAGLRPFYLMSHWMTN